MDAGAALRKLVGGLLLAAGAIIALSCGLCTGYFAIASAVAQFTTRNGDALAFTAPFLLAGLVATAVGVGVAWGGVALLRGSFGGDTAGSGPKQDE